MEPDLVEDILYRQLGFGRPPDGGPLDPQLGFATAPYHRPAFEAEPFDLAAALPNFSWPVAVISGERDLRTHRPWPSASLASPRTASSSPFPGWATAP